MNKIAEENNMIKNIELGYIDLCSLGIFFVIIINLRYRFEMCK